MTGHELSSCSRGGADHGLIDDQARLLLWERLRSLTAFHEQYASADWALPADVVGRLCEIASALESDSDPQRFAYLFDWHPNIPGVDRKDFNSYQAELGTLRTSALLSILKSDAGIGGVEALARRSAVPGQLGWVLGGISEVGLRDVLPCYHHPNRRLKRPARCGCVAVFNWAVHRGSSRPE